MSSVSIAPSSSFRIYALFLLPVLLSTPAIQPTPALACEESFGLHDPDWDRIERLRDSLIREPGSAGMAHFGLLTRYLERHLGPLNAATRRQRILDALKETPNGERVVFGIDTSGGPFPFAENLTLHFIQSGRPTLDRSFLWDLLAGIRRQALEATELDSSLPSAQPAGATVAVSDPREFEAVWTRLLEQKERIRNEPEKIGQAILRDAAQLVLAVLEHVEDEQRSAYFRRVLAEIPLVNQILADVSLEGIPESVAQDLSLRFIDSGISRTQSSYLWLMLEAIYRAHARPERTG